jgi:hypothetical protein
MDGASLHVDASLAPIALRAGSLYEFTGDLIRDPLVRPSFVSRGRGAEQTGVDP